MQHDDNWGWRARLGMFIVGNEAVPEAEWWAMAPAGVSVHASRVTAKSPWAPWREDRSGVDLPEDLTRGARQFAAMPLASVVLGHSSSSFVGGTGWDEAVVDALSEIIGSDTYVTTNLLDTLWALDAVEVRRPFLVVPPWFNDRLAEMGLTYLRERKISPAGHMRYDPGPGWRDMPPESLYGQGMGFAQQIEPLFAQIKASCPQDADGVLIAGTGFRCVGILEALEADLARPVISANQASLWSGLRRAGAAVKIPGYGRLLTL